MYLFGQSDWKQNTSKLNGWMSFQKRWGNKPRFLHILSEILIWLIRRNSKYFEIFFCVPYTGTITLFYFYWMLTFKIQLNTPKVFQYYSVLSRMWRNQNIILTKKIKINRILLFYCYLFLLFFIYLCFLHFYVDTVVLFCYIW